MSKLLSAVVIGASITSVAWTYSALRVRDYAGEAREEIKRINEESEIAIQIAIQKARPGIRAQQKEIDDSTTLIIEALEREKQKIQGQRVDLFRKSRPQGAGF